MCYTFVLLFVKFARRLSVSCLVVGRIHRLTACLSLLSFVVAFARVVVVVAPTAVCLADVAVVCSHLLEAVVLPLLLLIAVAFSRSTGCVSSLKHQGG